MVATGTRPSGRRAGQPGRRHRPHPAVVAVPGVAGPDRATAVAPARGGLGFPGACSAVTGWGSVDAWRPGSGRSDARALPDRLRAVDLPIVDNETCADRYGGRITDGQVCAGYRQGTMDSCQGDSGGPLVVPGGPTGWTQIGVVSWGAGCAQPGAYGVYTRVSSYIDWILEQTSR